MTSFRRPLLASILAGVLAGSPVAPTLAQEPASAPTPHTVTQGAVPISLGVTKRDFTHSPKPFPNLLLPYTEQHIDPSSLTNSPRLDQLIHDSKLYLSLQDAIALALENSMDIVVQRYTPWMADVSLLKARVGGYGYGTPGSIAIGSTANLPVLFYDPTITQVICRRRHHSCQQPLPFRYRHLGLRSLRRGLPPNHFQHAVLEKL